jgi:hypothetical protein
MLKDSTQGEKDGEIELQSPFNISLSALALTCSFEIWEMLGDKGDRGHCPGQSMRTR